MEKDEKEEEIHVPETDDGDSSSLSDEEDDKTRVFLGFAMEEDEADEPTDFPSTVGGVPFWPRSVASLFGRSEEFLCGTCHQSMPLLCELYAPLEWIESAYHRFISLFVCTRASCWKHKHCVLALRSQLRKEESPVAESLNLPVICHVCAKPSFKSCGKCHKRHYCSQGHQVWDWKMGHKQCCGKEGKEPTRSFGDDNLIVLKRMVMETEEEKYEFDKESVAELASANSALVSLETRSKLMPLTPEETKMMENSKKADSTFVKFQHRTRDNQDQVLRYAFGAKKPLWVNSENQLIGNPPNCKRCGAKRVFEFQIMPQLLFFLKVDLREETAMDWNSLIIYSCERSCDAEDGYVSEHVFIH
jgi:pre-rRNA-processing protein TSR4